MQSFSQNKYYDRKFDLYIVADKQQKKMSIEIRYAYAEKTSAVTHASRDLLVDRVGRIRTIHGSLLLSTIDTVFIETNHQLIRKN